MLLLPITLIAPYIKSIKDCPIMNETSVKYKKLVHKCWTDPVFADHLMNNPKEILKQEGIEITGTISVAVIQNSETHFTLVIPAKPNNISEEHLENLVQHANDLYPHFQALP
jgi:glyceraldehyde-3-phosphate dehydrogenase/erythrose-4-phosphate dehydrogenase